METTDLEEQVAADAESLKGEVTEASLEGELTVTPAMAGRDMESRATPARRALEEIFMRQSP
jgi:hypothetical protein